MAALQLVLASASPARRRLLNSIGIEPIVRPSDVDEAQIQLTDPSALVQELARLKAEAVADLMAQRHPQEPMLVLGCDSVLSIHGEIHGKPASPAAAIARWQQMRGQVGQLYTGHALLELSPAADPAASRRQLVRCQVTTVFFAPVSDRQIAAYVATGEPLNCAGCFALEGKGGLFVEKLEGCHSNVIGLSLPLLRQMVTDLGYDVTDFWAAEPSNG
jgi:septum formation protein